MLVLGRLVNQAVKIGSDIVVRVLEISPSGQVKLGFEAPREIPIIRTELEERK
jgi:carbon storage regulator CsrA